MENFMITDMQYKRLLKIFNCTGKILMSSIKSGMDRKTGAKYIKSGKFPSASKSPHAWRTRSDPFADVVEELEKFLAGADDLNASSIFEYFQEKYPGKFHDGQLRTLERRVKQWKLKNGKSKLLSVPQEHIPGKLMQLDWTYMNELKITIGGVVFKHLLSHAVLTYSNWQWAEIAYSESFLSLKKCFQSAVFRLGAVPEILQTDNSTTATHQVHLGKKAREFNNGYLTFLKHYDVKPRTINVNCPDENGDVESANGHLKRRIEQHLLIRGNRDFSSIDEYRKFLSGLLIKANCNRTEKLKEELEAMRALPEIRLCEYIEEEKKVSSFGTIRINKMAYSVPSRLKHCKVRVRTYEDKIKLYSGTKYLLSLDKKNGKGYCIDYRHVVKTLQRKPGAFANCRYKEQLFPQEAFIETYEYFRAKYGERVGDREYLEILNLAAMKGEDRVVNILKKLLKEKEQLTVENVKLKLNIPISFPSVKIAKPTLSTYNSLLEKGGECHVERFIGSVS
jgi:hypothetical protein